MRERVGERENMGGVKQIQRKRERKRQSEKDRGIREFFSFLPLLGMCIKQSYCGKLRTKITFNWYVKIQYFYNME